MGSFGLLLEGVPVLQIKDGAANRSFRDPTTTADTKLVAGVTNVSRSFGSPVNMVAGAISGQATVTLWFDVSNNAIRDAADVAGAATSCTLPQQQ